MTDKQIIFVYNQVIDLLMGIFDIDDATQVADSIIDDVLTDIEETADPETWHSGDVQIALARVLKSKIVQIDQ